MSKFVAILFVGFVFLHLSTASAQVNADSIAQAAKGIDYSSLALRLQQSDSTLGKTDFLLLYYGSRVQAQYNSILIDSLELKIKEYNLLQEFMNAYELADSLLSFHPVSITAYFEKSFACYGLKRLNEEAGYKQKYFIFIRCVLSSGNGSAVQPWMVVSYSDALEVLKHQQIKYKDLLEIDDRTFMATLSKKYKGNDKVYFKLVDF